MPSTSDVSMKACSSEQGELPGLDAGCNSRMRNVVVICLTRPVRPATVTGSCHALEITNKNGRLRRADRGLGFRRLRRIGFARKNICRLGRTCRLDDERRADEVSAHCLLARAHLGCLGHFDFPETANGPHSADEPGQTGTCPATILLRWE
jgi:hypothetical protein